MIAEEAINIRGFSGAVIGRRFIAYIGFDSPGDANQAVNIFQEAEAVTAWEHLAAGAPYSGLPEKSDCDCHLGFASRDRATLNCSDYTSRGAFTA